ncbi:MAG: hypothetical protein JW769_02010 [Parachlamydiales bacterium]|nr:hypothetical protein [Parachlamydiales bacterium]
MDMPISFAKNPGQSPHKYLLNLLKQFHKKILRSSDAEELNQEMEAIINASRDIPWKEKNGAIHKKSGPKKTFDKLFNEFKRYSLSLEAKEFISNQDLLDILEETIHLIEEEPIP